MSFNTRNYNEGEWVRLRPSLMKGFDFGQINDVLRDERVGVIWSINKNRERVIFAEDVIRCSEHGEGFILYQVAQMIWNLKRKKVNIRTSGLMTVRERLEYRKEKISEIRRRILAIEFALEYWLDLRRDGLNVQAEDLVETIAKVERLLDGYAEEDRQAKDGPARVAGSGKGGLNG